MILRTLIIIIVIIIVFVIAIDVVIIIISIIVIVTVTVIVIVIIIIVIIIIIISEPTLPPRDLVKVSDNGTCAILKWKPPYLSKSDNRSFPAKVGKSARSDYMAPKLLKVGSCVVNVFETVLVFFIPTCSIQLRKGGD